MTIDTANTKKENQQVSKITENQKNMLQSFSEDEQRFAYSICKKQWIMSS